MSNDYKEQLKQEFSNLFETLDLQESQKHYLEFRWLDQVLWMESKAGSCRDSHYRLRLMTIVGGTIIPALVSLNFTDQNPQLKITIAVSTFVLSQVVAISAAIEQFFNYGERWRHYRRSVESLKTQGWQFFQLSDAYEKFPSHNQAFKTFATQVEQILQRDVEVYSTQVTAQKESAQQETAINDDLPNSENQISTSDKILN